MHRTKSPFSIDFSQLEHVEATSSSDGSGTIQTAVACRLVSLLDLTSSISSVVLVSLIARGNCLSFVKLFPSTFEIFAYYEVRKYHFR
jgi:hypothetical protein